MFEIAAEAANGYGPNIVGAIVGGVITGLVAALVAIGTARHEVKQADKRRDQEREEREAQERKEQAERQARDEEARKNSLRQSVVASFVEACGRLQASIQIGDAEAIVRDMTWTGSRYVQLRLLLHGEGRDDVLDWFDGQWDHTFGAVRNALPSLRGRMWDMPLNQGKLIKAQNALTALEYVCARWEVQPLDLWSTEKPPEWLIKSEGKRPSTGSEDGSK